MTPADVSFGSHYRAWWICEKGHEWQAVVNSRTDGKECPICKNRTLMFGANDLATTHPHIAAQWHPTKNGDLKPQDIVFGSHKKVWWICEKGHSWECSPNSRISNQSGCPVCSSRTVIPGENDLASNYPNIAAQWHPTKNGDMTPQSVTAFSNKTVWWLCEAGHDYQTAISRRTRGLSNCPYCTNRKILPGFNDLATKEPTVAKEWHPELNGTLTPQMVTKGSRKRVWWKCNNGHVWQAVIYSRASGEKVGCPVCAGKVKEEKVEKYGEIIEKM